VGLLIVLVPPRISSAVAALRQFRHPFFNDRRVNLLACAGRGAVNSQPVAIVGSASQVGCLSANLGRNLASLVKLNRAPSYIRTVPSQGAASWLRSTRIGSIF
jgi:hypothetical protein